MDFQFISWEAAPCTQKDPLQPAAWLRKEFSVDTGLTAARLHMTSLGNYIPYVNGIRPYGSLLTPGYTEYSVRLQYQTYDVTSLLKDGVNCLSAVVGDGWYRGSCGPMGMRATYGTTLALAAVLELCYGEKTVTVSTDPSWKWTNNGPICRQDIKLLEYYDARKELTGWNLPGYDDSLWGTCTASSYGGEVIPTEGEAVLAHERFSPVMFTDAKGNTVLDFGQNIAGYVSFRVRGKAGDKLTMIHGEALDENGCFTVANLGDSAILRLGQELTYILKDGLQQYEPMFLVCGFRYVKITADCEVLPENFEAAAIYSDLPMTGDFECSNPKINRLVKNIQWSLKGNFVDIPTDCPHRERAGWSGDINVFSQCAALLSDDRKFLRKWIKDLILTQREDGAVLSIVPKVFMMNRKSNETTPGAAGWADAITQIPMQQYLSFGDTEILELCYDAMKKHVEFNRKRAAEEGKLKKKLDKSPDKCYVLDTGYHYGEWLEPGAANLVDGMKAAVAPDSEVATAWFFYSAKTLSEVAEILGKAEDAAEYAVLAEEIRKAYIAHFLKDGVPDSSRQCKYVRPLYMGIVQGEDKARTAKALNDLVVSNGYRIGTGFLSTYQILNVLSDNGYVESAYRMLENEECPGWLYEVNKGATTIWEGWDAVDPKTNKVKHKSMNHYSPGAALSWLWTDCAGIRSLAPGYRKIQISPLPGGSFTYAKAIYRSVSGEIASSWKKEDGEFVLDVVIPPDVEAKVVLPDGTVYENAATGRYTCKI